MSLHSSKPAVAGPGELAESASASGAASSELGLHATAVRTATAPKTRAQNRSQPTTSCLGVGAELDWLWRYEDAVEQCPVA